MKMISKSKLLEIRRSLYDDDGYTRINNPHFDLIFEEAFKAGIKQVNNVVLDDVIKCDCKLEKHERAKMELDYNKCMDCKKPIE